MLFSLCCVSAVAMADKTSLCLAEDGGDAKLTDFGLHAQLEAIEKSSQTKSL